MKKKIIGILLCLLSFQMPALAGTEGHGGDEIRLLFEDGRVDAFQRIPQIKRCSLPASTSPQVVDWILKNKNLLATDIFKSQHVWITDQQSTCAFTQVKPEFDVTLSFQTCENVKTKEIAGRLLTHESVHHLGVADESFADAVAFAIYAADLTKSCNPPATDPFDPLSCHGDPITLEQVSHLLKPNTYKTKVGDFKVHARSRYCQTLGGCTDWLIGADSTNPQLDEHGLPIVPSAYNQMGLIWSDGTPVSEKQLVGEIDLFNHSNYLTFGLTAAGDYGVGSASSAHPLESNGLDKGGFFDYNIFPHVLNQKPKFNGRLTIDGQWAGRTRSLVSSIDRSSGIFTETNITNTCLRTKWSYSSARMNPDSYSETEVVVFGNLDL
jgi:hypothetical protein